MIGVVAKAEQIAVVGEFFEFFKTPWEFYDKERSYDVILCHPDEVPEVQAGLIVIHGNTDTSYDSDSGIRRQGKVRDTMAQSGNDRFPIYGETVIFEPGNNFSLCVTCDSGAAGLSARSGEVTTVRLGYDLFEQIEFILSKGQPVDHASIPTIDVHIALLRKWMLEAGISFLEIPPVPAGYPFAVCLSHDIDFIAIRQHRFDHTMWGFLYRSSIGAIRDYVRGRISTRRLIKIWKAAFSLPFVHLGWVKDFWNPFEWYLRIEKDLPATYFMIPFKNRAGEKVAGRHAKRRATAYDINDVADWSKVLQSAGCEIGVHGIDAWHSAEKGSEELARVAAVTGQSEMGIRMHWLLNDQDTFEALEKSGYCYDSTAGYNETPGYRAGTSQVFRPLSTRHLLELPMHIQDGALFYPQKLDLPETEAWKLCQSFITRARRFGGALTVLWHDRSHAAERFWGDFYARLVGELRGLGVWFATAGQAVGWFRKRRAVKFERVHPGSSEVHVSYDGEKISPALLLRWHSPEEATEEKQSVTSDIVWTGEAVPDKAFGSACRV